MAQTISGGLINEGNAIDGSVLVSKILIPAVLAPVTAGLVSFLATKIAYGVTRKRERDRFKIGHVFTSSLVSLTHRINDAQKTMGGIMLTLIAAGFQRAPLREPAAGRDACGRSAPRRRIYLVVPFFHH